MYIHVGFSKSIFNNPQLLVMCSTCQYTQASGDNVSKSLKICQANFKLSVIVLSHPKPYSDTHSSPL